MEGRRAVGVSRPAPEEGRTTLLEVGSGPGTHGKWFADNGLTVACTDLSPEHVRLCREKGLEAFVAPFLEMDFGGRTFDAAFALNCLLHVPPADLPRALGRIRAAIAPGGLFFLGQYGGDTSDGIDEWDSYEPKRYFSFLSDGDMQRRSGDAGFAGHRVPQRSTSVRNGSTSSRSRCDDDARPPAAPIGSAAKRG